MFTGEHDDTDCIVQINAKDGGVDAQDFSEMLLRMYEKWCERRGFTITLNGCPKALKPGSCRRRSRFLAGMPMA